MAALLEAPRMGGVGGRPKGNQDAGTRQVRVMEDIADKIAWIVRIRGGTTATLLDPIIRAQIEDLYTEIEPQALKIKSHEDALKKAEAEAQEEARKKKSKKSKREE